MPLLENLHLSTLDFERNLIPAFIDFLSRHPSIQNISFVRCPGALIATLALTPTRRVRPKLRSITLDRCAPGQKTLVEIVKSRTASVEDGGLPRDVLPLQEFHVINCRGIPAETISELEKRLVGALPHYLPSSTEWVEWMVHISFATRASYLLSMPDVYISVSNPSLTCCPAHESISKLDIPEPK